MGLTGVYFAGPGAPPFLAEAMQGHEGHEGRGGVYVFVRCRRRRPNSFLRDCVNLLLKLGEELDMLCSRAITFHNSIKVIDYFERSIRDF